ncbi:MAG: hypothetical protein A2428_02650 [Bdellovibrionales bacterium RIFOXYC1_FULL_54_43]|nr:MAG: hypothetical protein A2428_02650 [Bdellovibrionales bacterium RIFOXYC1_FULL_54_43]OFZ79545.1 MAG: hypothetical protein A2603_12950 [Bdellovibrionales bacterium RIFOXYD1_FULL_55_31]
MKRYYIAVAAFSVLVAASGCTKNADSLSKKQSPAQQGAAQDSPAWKINLTVKCGDAADQCIAAHGFTVSADGQYEMGPGPEGQIKSGPIAAEDFLELSTLITQSLEVVHFEAERAESCSETNPIEIEETVLLTHLGRQKTVMHTSGSSYCFQTTTIEAAEALHNAIRKLAEQYYSLPFPDRCAEAASAVENLYSSFQGCSTEADCAYLTNSFEVIPSGSPEFVMTDDCSIVRPAVVGNATAVFANQSQLAAAIDTARSVCGIRMVRQDCTGVSGFQASSAAPVCEQNVCRIPPSLRFH